MIGEAAILPVEAGGGPDSKVGSVANVKKRKEIDPALGGVGESDKSALL